MTHQSTSDRLLFLRKFLRHGTHVASIAPSSRALAKELCWFIDAQHPQTIVELGAGSGAVTMVAADTMHPASTLIAVERDADFAALLRQRCPAARIIEADAADITAHLAAQDIRSVDVVISGLPLPSMPPTVVRRVLASVHALAPACWFSQLTVMPWVYQRFYQRLFREVQFVPIWRNLPPGGVYHCHHVGDEVLTMAQRDG